MLIAYFIIARVSRKATTSLEVTEFSPKSPRTVIPLVNGEKHTLLRIYMLVI
jgi:hypothetical protein